MGADGNELDRGDGVVAAIVSGAQQAADPKVDAFLWWLCKSLPPPSPPRKQKDLSAARPPKVTDGHAAVDAHPEVEEAHIQSDGLPSDVAARKSQMEVANESAAASVGRLRRQRDALERRIAELADQKNGTAAASSRATAADNEVQIAVSSAAAELAAARDSAVASAQTLIETRRTGSGAPKNFLTQCGSEFESLVDCERRCAAGVDQSVTDHFEGGLGRAIVETDNSRFEWLALNDPSTFVVRDGSIAEYSSLLDELLRLRAMDEVTSHQEYAARLECAELEAAIRCTHEAASKAHYYATASPERVQDQIVEAKARTAELNVFLEAKKAEFATVAAEAAAAFGAATLTGNYGLQLERQAYCAKHQDAILREVLQQRARQELALGAVLAEKRIHTEALHLLAAFNRRVELCSLESAAREAAFVAAAAQPLAPPEHSQIPVSDSTMRRICLALGIPDDQEATYSDVIQALDDLLVEHATVEASVAQRQTNLLSQREQTERIIQTCIDLIFDQALIETVETPLLAPKQVEDTLSRVDSHLDTLTSAIRFLEQQIETHQQLLAEDPVARRSASLMEDFFNNPQKLSSEGTRTQL